MNALPFLDQMLSYALLAVTLLGYFVLGFAIDASMFLSLLMGAWLAVYAAVRWWMFIFPQAKHALHQPWRLLYELKLMLFSAMGFFVAGRGGMAAAFVAGILVHVTLVLTMHQHRRRVDG